NRSGLRGLLRLAAPGAGVRAGPGAGTFVRRARGIGRTGVLRRLIALPPLIGRVEPRPLVVHRDRMQHALQRRRPAHLARGRAVLRHSVNDLEEVAVGALVLVERHGSGKATSGTAGLPGRARLAAAAAIVAALVLPGVARAHATLVRTSPQNGAVLAAAPN